MPQPHTTQSEETSVWEIVQEMNRLWTEKGEPAALTQYFHPQMVAVCAGVKSPIVGGKACVAGWSDFTHRVSNLSFEERSPLIRIVGQTAIVAYDFDCSYEEGGKAVAMTGRDLLTLVKTDGTWQVIADHFSPMPT